MGCHLFAANGAGNPAETFLMGKGHVVLQMRMLSHRRITCRRAKRNCRNTSTTSSPNDTILAGAHSGVNGRANLFPRLYMKPGFVLVSTGN